MAQLRGDRPVAAPVEPAHERAVALGPAVTAGGRHGAQHRPLVARAAGGEHARRRRERLEQRVGRQLRHDQRGVGVLVGECLPAGHLVGERTSTGPAPHETGAAEQLGEQHEPLELDAEVLGEPAQRLHPEPTGGERLRRRGLERDEQVAGLRDQRNRGLARRGRGGYWLEDRLVAHDEGLPPLPRAEQAVGERADACGGAPRLSVVDGPGERDGARALQRLLDEVRRRVIEMRRERRDR